MKRRTKIALITTGSFLAVGLLAVTGLTTYNKMTGKAQATKKVGYQTYVATYTPALTMTGKVMASKTQTLNVPSGKLQTLNVTDGQVVKNGDVLLTVTNTEIQDAIDAQNDVINKANRAATNAATSLKNIQQGYGQANTDTKSSLKGEVVQAQQTVNDANAELQEAQNKLVELQNKQTTNLTAPFDGIISVDNNTKDGIPALTLNASQKILQANISEYDYHKIHSGDQLVVSGIDGSPTQSTTVDKIQQIPNGDGKGTTYYPFTANVKKDFLYGQSIKVEIPQRDIKIPKSAIYKNNIYKVIDGKASRIKAEVTQSGTSTIVNSGIVKGEKIVLNPDSHLKNGESIDD